MDTNKSTVEYSDVMQMDIRIGRVVEAERIPKKTKLLKLRVSFGAEDVRDVVTNIGSQFEPENLIDKTMPFILNMTPFEIAGVVSQAMILASNNVEGAVSLFTTDAKEGDIVI